jgi:hypothetical protein
VLVQGTDATAYIPLGNWGITATTGVEVLPIETNSGIGTGGPAVAIKTPNTVNSCSSNSATGQTVCVANNTDVYLITGTSLNMTLTSGADGTASLSGGFCKNCGVVVDSVLNKALITEGLSTSTPGVFQGGFQFLELGATPTFETPIPVGVNNQFTSEDASIDPNRHLVLSPNESSNYQLLDISAGTDKAKVLNNPISKRGLSFEFDSAGEDCTTGIALASTEGLGDLYIADLTQATFDTTKGTWTDTASQVQSFPEFLALSSQTCGIAVAPGKHFGLVTGEFGGNLEGVIQLPASSGTGTPAVLDWVVFTVPNEPTGATFSLGFDPHTVTAYVSPNIGKALGVMADGTPNCLAIADLEGLIKAPRTGPGSHTVITPLPAGLVTFKCISP